MNHSREPDVSGSLTQLLRRLGSLAPATMVVFLLVNGGCQPQATTTPPISVPPTSNKSASSELALEGQIEHFCGNCHATPKPESFPKSMWNSEVKRGFDFYFDSRRSDLSVPIQAQVAEYFRDHAPSELPWGPAPSTADTSPVKFIREELSDAILNVSNLPAISFLDHNDRDAKPTCWMSDMRSGEILFGDIEHHRWRKLSHSATNPVAVRVCDLNGNEIPDLLITDLGSFLPADHQMGKLLWLADVTGLNLDRSVDNPPQFAKSESLLQNIGRVADVQTGDLDGDGDLDIVIAEFGWHQTGGVHILWNDTVASASNNSVNAFRYQQLDRRPGAIHVACTDINRDGRLDVVALLSQEHETIIAWLNEPKSDSPQGFELVPHTLYAAGDPSAGSSGMVVVDFDQDGDGDVIYTSGDTFDSFINKPSHGVCWLETRGEWPFTVHRLTGLPGAHRALPADLDQDGDLDLAVCAFVPEKLRGLFGAEHQHAVIWLEQRSPGEFVRHLISQNEPECAAMTVYDIDGDGDSDLVTGAFREIANGSRRAVTVFRNGGVRSK